MATVAEPRHDDQRVTRYEKLIATRRDRADCAAQSAHVSKIIRAELGKRRKTVLTIERISTCIGWAIKDLNLWPPGCRAGAPMKNRSWHYQDRDFSREIGQSSEALWPRTVGAMVALPWIRGGKTPKRHRIGCHQSNLTDWQKPYCKRLIRSFRRECCNPVIVLNEHHERRLLRSYRDYSLNALLQLSHNRNTPIEREIEPIYMGRVKPIPQRRTASSLPPGRLSNDFAEVTHKFKAPGPCGNRD